MEQRNVSEKKKPPTNGTGGRTMNELKLKPCPFCDGEAREETNYAGEIRIRCSNIYRCSIHQEWFDMEEDAIAAWNRRSNDE